MDLRLRRTTTVQRTDVLRSWKRSRSGTERSIAWWEWEDCELASNNLMGSLNICGRCQGWTKCIRKYIKFAKICHFKTKRFSDNPSKKSTCSCWVTSTRGDIYIWISKGPREHPLKQGSWNWIPFFGDQTMQQMLLVIFCSGISCNASLFGFHCCSPPVRWGLLDFMSALDLLPPPPPPSPPPVVLLNCDPVSSVWRAGPQPRSCEFSVACWTPTAILRVQCGVPDPIRDPASSVWRAGPQPRSCEFSVAARAPTAILWVQCGGPDPNRDPVSSVWRPDPNRDPVSSVWRAGPQVLCQKICQKEWQKMCQKECEKTCQKECQKICQKECQEICQKEWRKICQKECQKICQKECQKICQ